MSDVVTWNSTSPPAALADAKPKRPILVVLGMHRSGLMVCAAALAILGIDIGDGFGAYRTDGERPSDDLMDIQDEVLALFGRGVETPTHDYPMPPGWWADGRLRPLVTRMKDLLGRRLEQPGAVGLNDPRMAKLMPLWTRVFTDLGLLPRYVVCLRDPVQVARSLETRQGLDLDTGEFRTLDYVVDALRYTNGHDRLFLRFSDWSDDPFAVVARLQAFVGGASTVQAHDLDLALRSLIGPRLTATSQQPATARQPLVQHFFELVDTFAGEGGEEAGVADRIRSFIDNYVAFRQLLGPFEAKHRAAMVDRAVDTPARIVELEAALQAAETANAQLRLSRTTLDEDVATARSVASEAEKTTAALELRLATGDGDDTMRTELEEAHAARVDAETRATRLGQVIAELQADRGRSEQEHGERTALSQDLAALRIAHAELESKAAELERVQARTAADLEHAQAARADAESRAAAFEIRLHDHSVALSDTLAALAAAETAQRSAEEQRRLAEQAADAAQADVARLRHELDQASAAPARKRRW